MKVVINKCYGGFGLSEAAYEKLHEWGVPIQKWADEKRDATTGLIVKDPANQAEVIFDRSRDEASDVSVAMISLSGTKYWDGWTAENRDHPLLVRVVEELGDKASGSHAELAVVEIPDDIKWEVEEYDGREQISECHRSWS